MPRAGYFQPIIKGDGVVGRVLRCSELRIFDATEAGKIKCLLNQVWNGDVISLVDNLAKGATVGDFSLDADGDRVTIESTGLTGGCIGVLTASLICNGCGTSLIMDPFQSTGAIVVDFAQEPNNSIVDLTALVDVGDGFIYAIILYLTDA